ncbi:PAS domain-containing protein [Rhodoferax sp. BLA1]|uniref:PAS domain-containing protein n=1 Tax=Rhodoferax sp. BLA1 TaxID=2576062 RepID=UPI0015D44617
MNDPLSDVNKPPAADKHPDPKVLLRAALDALPDNAVVLDAQGVIVMTNIAWRQYAMAYSSQSGLPASDSDLGANYLEVALRGHSPEDSASRAVQGIRDVLSGRMEAFCMTYPCHTPGAQIWFTMTVTPLEWDGDTGVLITHTDTTPRHRLAPR